MEASLEPGINNRLALFFLHPDGRTETQPIAYGIIPVWSAAKAVPNGIGGFLIQVVQGGSGPSSGQELAKAGVIGVDAFGNVTGSTGLTDSWGDLVVGETSAIAVTNVTYQANALGRPDDPHVHPGWVQPLTLEGNVAAPADVYQPAGDCGWHWSGQQWDFLGDCGPQPVTSVTSVLAQSGGGFISNLSDGRVLGADPRFEQMQLTHVQYLGDGEYVGAPAGAGVARLRGGPSMPERRTPWPGYGGNDQSADAAATGRGIFVKGYRVRPGAPYFHTTIQIIPAHQERWRNRKPWDPTCNSGSCFNNSSWSGYFATLGAENSAPGCLDGTLLAAINRPNDVTTPPIDKDAWEKLQYPALDEDRLIARLLELITNVQAASTNGGALPYSCFFTEGTGYYNSNSFTRGMLLNTPITLPRFPSVGGAQRQYPAWDKPVPSIMFQR